MQQEKFNKKDLIIKYGDIGYKYYILEKGTAKVIIYEKGTDPNDPNIDKK